MRAKLHDASKFSDAERTGYIWLTEFHRCRRNGEAFFYPAGMEDIVRQAIKHHVTTNRHHPEFHATPADMSDVDLIETNCDWTAMAQEFGEDGGSARPYADRTLGRRLILPDDRVKFVHQVIKLVDRRLSDQEAANAKTS